MLGGYRIHVHNVHEHTHEYQDDGNCLLNVGISIHVYTHTDIHTQWRLCSVLRFAATCSCVYTYIYVCRCIYVLDMFVIYTHAYTHTGGGELAVECVALCSFMVAVQASGEYAS
jgi:hypothetical protein